MSTATINLNVMPRRMLTLREAAKYVGLDVKRFHSACAVPAIDLPGGIKQYDIRDLDLWVDHIKAGSSDPDDAILSLLDKKVS